MKYHQNVIDQGNSIIMRRHTSLIFGADVSKKRKNRVQ